MNIKQLHFNRYISCMNIMSQKPTSAWYLAPILMGIFGSFFMWLILKNEDNPDAVKMVKKGWIIGIVLTIIGFILGLIPLLIMPGLYFFS